MTAIRTILHPTDFSAPSAAALELACSIASHHGARLVILHVAPYELATGGFMTNVLEARPYRDDALNEVRDRIVGPSHVFPVETCLREGTPAEEILCAADDIVADLIVMGSHGRTGLGRLLMGSVAEAVMRRATCPVLLAKQPADPSARGEQDKVKAAPGRVIVTQGWCQCGVHNVYALHRDFPEYWAEGTTSPECAEILETKLTRARDGCCRGDWHDNDLARAIEDVRAFRAALSLGSKPGEAMVAAEAMGC